MARARRTPRFPALVVVLTLATACGGNAAAEARTEALRRWEASGPDDYRFVWRTSAMVGQTRLAVEVRDGAVVAVDPLQEGWRMLEDESLTVERIFAELAEIQQQADAVDVVYDPELGHPRSVAVDVIEEAVDDEYAFSVEDLQAL